MFVNNNIHKQDGIATKSLIIIISIMFFTITVAFLISFMVDKERNENIKRMQSKELNYKFSLFGYNYTKEDLQVFLDAANDCENYSFCFYESNDLITGKVYNGKYYYSNSEEEIYYDNNTKTYIKISKKDKTYEKCIKKLDEKNRNVLANVALAFLKCNNLSIKHIKEEKYKEFNCVVERFSLDDYEDFRGLLDDKQVDILKEYQNRGVKISYDFWIEKASGLIAKYDIVLCAKKNEENRIEYDTNLTISKLSENDICEPDESKYETAGYKIIK